MNLLAIETSCDETAAAVIAETGDAAKPWQLRSNVVASQADIHRDPRIHLPVVLQEKIGLSHPESNARVRRRLGADRLKKTGRQKDGIRLPF